MQTTQPLHPLPSVSLVVPSLFSASVLSAAVLFAAALCFPACASAQNPPFSPLPSAPSPAQSIIPASQPPAPLTLRERFAFQAKTTFGPASFILPAAEAGITMADPPDHYPRSWSDGGGAFARNYGAELGRHVAGGLAHFTVAAIDREDPRYATIPGSNYGARFVHAILFTLIDRSDSGRRTLALSNLSGATAAGFVGMAWEPPGFDDATHAYQRSAVELTTFASHNVIAEFSPEFTRVGHKLHFPDRWLNSLLPEDRRR